MKPIMTLVLNSTAVMPDLQSIVWNLDSKAKVRTDTLEGREHLVVPMVMITEGVHNGSGGPLYYPKEELGKTPEAWNHKPIVVYHPQLNGKGVSACDPVILNSRKIGLILNTKWDGDRLTSEAWLEKSRTKKIDNRVLEALDKGLMVEVSTGLFTDNEKKEGEWKGEKFSAIARNYRPDHLAVLPDQKGSCSIADGAGLLRNADATHSHSRQLVSTALRKRDSYSYPEDMTPDRVIYTDKNGDLVHEGYSLNANKTEATLKGDAEKITRVTQYKKADGTVVANLDQNGAEAIFNKEKTNVNKAALIALLVANSAGVWTEADKEWLEKQDEIKLNGLAKPYLEKKETPAAPAPAAKPETPVPAPVKNAETTVQEYINNAPPQIRDMIASGLRSHEQLKAKAIATITTNTRNVFTKEQLQGKSLDELEAIVKIASAPAETKRPVANFAALADAFSPAPETTTNAGTKEEPLGLPKFEFAKKK